MFIKIKIKGIHCKSCKTLIQAEVGALKGVKRINIDHLSGACRVEFDSHKISAEKIFKKIEKLNYTVVKTKKIKPKKHSFPQKIIILGILFIFFAAAYFFIRYFGFLEIISQLNQRRISYWLIFLIGVLASFHCVGMCGGLIIAYASRPSAAKPGGKTRHSLLHLQYNAGRIISYTAIGGILGAAGSFFGINPTFTGIITLIAAGFMILMGLSLVTEFKWLEKIKPKTPSFISRFLFSQHQALKPKGPFIIGILNGFMPCGPLQAVQIYALASGNAASGALSMGIYAAGTAPLMFGFGSLVSLISREKISQAIKISGAIVIILGLLMLNRGLINFNLGFSRLSFMFPKIPNNTDNLVTPFAPEKKYQIAKMDLTYSGYSPSVLLVKKDIPVRWIISVKQMSGCTDEIIMPEYNIRKKLKYGENVIEFIPKKTGDIKFSCWMQMVWGKFVVT
ncbi:MAG: sulfite exporter TauE/SafE family protein [Patescibacteria group bacterium]|nr:sulfite exporter TauE/SafE family protein [Patescibacteria group bacterium]